ncbi:CHAT domain-containing protein [Streptomyces malaysiensis subsp. malaysiensis]|uniref:CHAT domain-containing protein n=1 Tax=Streptomyces malaysiensis TaxID=92644 RepID=UPI0024C06802|nr:CHAT domain-containing protein [Streptomyces sp. NA07423]WHX18568.1 CHAT domain-containing protein [Streptomyces sp. NA07423]
MTLAAVLARIAAEDIKGSSPRIISEHLRSAGIVVSEASVPLVANGLVMPVVRTVRGNGVPWERWWDVRGLSELLVELWTGRRLSTNSRERVRHELTALWRAPSQLLEIILENAENPFTCLPSDFLSESTTGVARNFMHAFVRLGKVKVVFGEDVLRCWPQLADRPDLAQIVQRWCRRNDLERVSRRVCVPLEVDGFRIDLDTWDARLRQLLSRLSAYEQTLMMPSTDDDRYSEKCLLAGQGLQQSRLLGDNDLLWDSKFGVQGTSVPEWMVEEIVTCGTRFFHTQVGPHPVWLATAETDLHLAAMQALMGPDTQGGFEVENYSDGLRLWLHFPVPSGDPGPAFQVPYTYSLSWVKHAWELLHLATVGYARLAIVQLIGDGELRAVGSMWLPLPDEVCARCKEAAVRALRRLVGDETQLIIQRATTEGRGQAAEAAFWSAENAKGEDIHDEVALVSNFDEYKHFMSAARYLGHVRAQYAASLLDRGVEGADVRMQLAEEERLRTLELLRGALDAKKEEAGASGILQTFPLSGQTLFVHLINRFGRLQLAAGWGGSDCMNCHLFSCAELSLDYLAEAIREWVRRPPECQGHVWPDHLQRLLGACTELAQSITEITAGYQFRRLVLSPTPPMELLPLHAVPLDTVHSVTLSDVFDHVAYAPTARLVSAIQRSERRQAEVEVLVVPHSGAGIPGIDPIGGPIIEAHVIATLRGGAIVLREEEATPARALQEMSKARIVHVASHGLTHPNRWAAGLALQGKTLGQATLTTSRILADGTFSSVDLVILNACRTGTHESTTLAVQTLRSLESAFLARGARAVISTLWEITDLQGLVFSAVLHAHLGVGVDPHTAYSDTIRYLRTHQWRVVSRCEAVVSAESIISVNLPGWRSYLDQQASENPLFWAAFKITGSA